MSVPIPTKSTFDGCKEAEAQKKPSVTDILQTNSAGLGALMEAAGITACSNTTIAGASLLPPFAAGGSAAHGCESLAAISSALTASQEIFNCTMTNFSTSVDSQSRSSSLISLKIGSDANFKNCSISLNQKQQVYIVKITNITNDIRQAMTAEVDNAMSNFATNIQSEKKSGLFGTSDGQKIIENFVQDVQQKVKQKAFINVVDTVLAKYEQSAEIVVDIGPRATINFQEPYKGTGKPPPCIELNQEVVINVISQEFITNALTIAFDSAAGNAMKNEIFNDQQKAIEGVGLPSIGGIVMVVVIVIILLVLMNSKGKGDNGQPKPILAGSAGKILGIVMMVAGFIAVIAGIVLFIIKAGVILSSVVLAGGAILAIFGIVIYLRARSQQAIFEQQLKLVTAGQVFKPGPPGQFSQLQTAPQTQQLQPQQQQFQPQQQQQFQPQQQQQQQFQPQQQQQFQPQQQQQFQPQQQQQFQPQQQQQFQPQQQRQQFMQR